MVFFTASKGYSAGGIGLTYPEPLRVWQPETLLNLEGGFKSTFFLGDAQLRTNVSGYYGFYDDAQVTSTRAVQVNAPPAPMSFLTVTHNAATARLAGVDAEITIVPVESIELGGTIGYSDHWFVRYPSLDAQGNPIDLSSSPFGFAPKMKYTLMATYHLPFDASIGDVSISADYYHRSGYYNVVKPIAQMSGGDIKGPHHNLNLSARWRDIMGTEGIDATLLWSNVTKNTETDGQFSGYSSVGYYTTTPAVPRMISLRLNYDF
jgi:iron complex outermembrane receptor protein